jgi:multidrug efflux pump
MRASSVAEGSHDPVDGRDREPLVAVVLVMASVFIPAAFLPGTTGSSTSSSPSPSWFPSWCPVHRPHADARDVHADAEAQSARAARFFAVQPPGRRVTRGFGHAVELVIKRWILRSCSSRVHLRDLPPVRDPAVELCRTRTRDGRSGDHRTRGREHRPRQAVAEKVDAIFARIPGVETAR